MILANHTVNEETNQLALSNGVRTSSVSKVLRMTETVAAFRAARVRVSFSGEYLQFLYCVLPSYNGFSFFSGGLVGDVGSAIPPETRAYCRRPEKGNLSRNLRHNLN